MQWPLEDTQFRIDTEVLEEVCRVTLNIYYTERFKEYCPLSLSKSELEKNLMSVYIRAEKTEVSLLHRCITRCTLGNKVLCFNSAGN